MQMMQPAGESLEKENIELKNDSENKERELKIKEVEANTRAYDAITKRLQVVGPLLTPDEVASLAVETKREALDQPDPGMPPSESMGIPEEMPPDDYEMQMQTQPEQPPIEGGFFMPEESPQEQPQQQFPA